jgi:hypothetical protein
MGQDQPSAERFLVRAGDSLVYYEEKQLRIVPKRKKKPTSSRDEFGV